MVFTDVVIWLARTFWYKWRRKLCHFGFSFKFCWWETGMVNWHNNIESPCYKILASMQSMENILSTSLWPESHSRFSYSVWKIQTHSVNKYSSCFGRVEYTKNNKDFGKWCWYECLSNSWFWPQNFHWYFVEHNPLFLFNMTVTS